MANEAWRRLRAVGENVVLYPFTNNKSRDWEAQELAEFYRVESVLIQNGIQVATDRGLTDEGDPWFVFCRDSDGETIVHFARIDGQYIIVSPAYDGVARGQDFREMVREMIDRHKLSLAVNDKGKSNVYIHPAVLLVVLVGAAFFKTPSSAQADELKKDLAQGVRSEPGAHLGSARFQSLGERSFSFLPDAQQSHNDQATLRNLWLIASAAILGISGETDAAARPALLPHGNMSDASIDFDAIALINRSSDNPQAVDLLSLTESETELAAPHLIGSDWNDRVDLPPTLLVNIDLVPIIKNNEAHMFETVFGVPLQAPIPTVFYQTSYFAAAMQAKTSLVSTQALCLSDATLHLGSKSSDKFPGQAVPTKSQEGSLGDDGSSQVKSTLSLGVSGDQVGSAITFLNENKIFELLQSEGAIDFQKILSFEIFSPAEIGADITSSPTGSVSDRGEGVVIVTSNELLMNGSLSTHDFLKALSAFFQEGEEIGLTVSDGIFVFYEESAPLSQDKITATFTDGSAISIVGQSELLQSILSDLV